MSQQSFISLGRNGFHRVAYTDWGDAAANHRVICVHGLSRNSRDFDFLARALLPQCRVVCMDVVGRGDSDWLDDPQEYSFGTYLTDAAALIARVTAPQRSSWFRTMQRRFGRDAAPQQLDWVGTSMGGLIGLLLAAKPGSPIRRLVLNDVGPLVPWNALFRLGTHLTRQTRFESREKAEAQVREACSGFGIDGNVQWDHVLAHSITQHEDGFALRYDPALAQPRHGPDPELPLGPDFLRGIDLWQAWDAIDCAVLVLRGAESDVLLPATVERMKRKRGVQVVEFDGIGHAPALMSAEQTQVVRKFLLQA